MLLVWSKADTWTLSLQVFSHSHTKVVVLSLSINIVGLNKYVATAVALLKISNFQILLRKITWIVSLMLCMLLLLLQVSGWCCPKVKVHCRVLYEMFTFTIWGLCPCALRWLSLLVIAALLGGEPLSSSCSTAGSCVLMQEQGPSNRFAAKICDNVIGWKGNKRIHYTFQNPAQYALTAIKTLIQ